MDRESYEYGQAGHAGVIGQRESYREQGYDTTNARARAGRHRPFAALRSSSGTHLVLPIIVSKGSSTMWSPCWAVNRWDWPATIPSERERERES